METPILNTHNKAEYEPVELNVILYDGCDVITTSSDENYGLPIVPLD